MPLALSYARVSALRQLMGLGLQRQIELAEAFVAKRADLNLTLDTSFRDLGVSAFDGSNRDRGALSALLSDVRTGRIEQGTYLLVESLDRLSRDEVLEALEPFLALVRAGIVIVTLADERIYSRETLDLPNLILSLSIMSRSHDESAIKRHRQIKTWQKKRETAGSKKLTARCPRWLVLNKARTDFDVIPERVEIVRRIFAELADGIGRDKIARRLNQEGIANWGHGRHWHGGSVQKLTDTRAVLGEFQSHRIVKENGRIRRVPAGDPVLDYFPRIIDEALWARARASAAERSVPARNPGGRRGTVFSNLFSGLARCQVCNQVMNYRDRGPRSTVVLRCSGERSGKCTNRARIGYPAFERRMLDFFTSWEVDKADEVQRAEDALAGLMRKRDDLDSALARLLDFIERGDEDIVRARYLERRSERKDVETAIAEATNALATAREETNDGRVTAIVAMAAIPNDAPDAERFAVRAKAAQMIRRDIQAIECRSDGGWTVHANDGASLFDFPAGEGGARLTVIYGDARLDMGEVRRVSA